MTAAVDRESQYPEEPEISGETWPTALSNGQFFGLRGIIVCRYPLTEIQETVTNRVTKEVILCAFRDGGKQNAEWPRVGCK